MITMGLLGFLREAKQELGPTPKGTDWMTGERCETRPVRTLIGKRETKVKDGK